MAAKDTFFFKKSSLNCKGKLVDISTPLVMGILNVTPDSFFDGNRYTVAAKIKARVSVMLDEGIDIIDIGGASSRPKAKIISEKEELKRVLPAIELVAEKFPDTIISVDTFRSAVAQKSIESGAHIVNDIGAGNFDVKMFDTIATLNVPYIMMHQKGNFETMHQSHLYENLMKEVIEFFMKKIVAMRERGISDIIIDPGFGFSKSIEQNFYLLKNLSLLNIFEVPVLAGLSRKSMINKIVKTKPDEALNGTSVLNTLALQNGANILRVHDIKQAKQAIQLFQFYKEQ